MRRRWIPGLLAVALLAALAVDAGAARGQRKERTADELLNVFLPPGQAQWLVGPIARLASEEEVESYLAITDEEAAERFIAEFWSRRKPIDGLPGLTARQQFEHLASEADRRFGEATFPGRRTDRGTIFILYGPPDEIDYKPARKARYGEIEVWYYRRARIGLDGKAPEPSYKFIRDGDLTRFAKGSELPKLLL